MEAKNKLMFRAHDILDCEKQSNLAKSKLAIHNTKPSMGILVKTSDLQGMMKFVYQGYGHEFPLIMYDD